MKYVVFRQKNLFIPVIIPECATHCHVRILNAKPVLAGFFTIQNGEVLISNLSSESLNLGPGKLRDIKLLTDLLNNSGMYAFVSYD